MQRIMVAILNITTHKMTVTVPSGSKLHNSPFLVLAVSFETSEYTFVYNKSFG